MQNSWDTRVVSGQLLDFIRSVQHPSCRLSGGAVLSGVHLRHRLSNDLDFFCDTREIVRELLRSCAERSEETGAQFSLIRDGGTFIRARLSLSSSDGTIIDIAYEPSAPLAPRESIEGIVVDSLKDLRANKITCLLSRQEPRDLVDLYFLDRLGQGPENFLQDALRKDAGVDPGVLSYLLRSFPVSPMPLMLEPLDEESLRAFRDELSERLRTAVLPVKA